MSAERVQLGMWEFERALLQLPQHDWRVVADRQREGWGHVALATPASGHPWLLVGLSRRGDHWQTVSELDPASLRPDKATRRRGLRLDWPTDALDVRVGETLHTVVHLLNEAEADWYEREDPLTVLTFILHAGTQELLPSEQWKAFAPLRSPAALVPAGGTRELPAKIAVRHGAVPPGRHAVRASVMSLELHSPSIPLTVR